MRLAAAFNLTASPNCGRQSLASAQRVTVPPPAQVMPVTPSAAGHNPVAAVDAAHTITHVDPA
jgi:hypothetical protein